VGQNGAATDGLVIREDRGAGVAGLALNRPEKLNAISREVIAALVDGVDRCVADESVRVIVIRGAGRAFSAGADASPEGTVRAASASENREDMLDHLWGRFIRLYEAPKPIIAQVHGYCLGVATVLCSFVDAVVVADDATIGWPSLPLGGGVEDVIWAWHVGIRKAKEYAFQPGTRISGREAEEVGWANAAVPATALHDEVQSMASRMARTPPGLLRLKKEAINRIQDRMGFRDTMKLSAAWCVISHTDPVIAGTIDVMRNVGIKEAMAHFEAGGTGR
jgi:enoyl-CoA hydratase